MLEKNTRKTLTAEPLRKLSLRISGCDAAPVVPWNRDGSHGFSPVKAHADSAGVSCRVATTATCEKRYLPNGLVSLLQSIEAGVARRPLGLQLAGGSGASHRFERTAGRTLSSTVPLTSSVSLFALSGVAPASRAQQEMDPTQFPLAQTALS